MHSISVATRTFSTRRLSTTDFCCLWKENRSTIAERAPNIGFRGRGDGWRMLRVMSIQTTAASCVVDATSDALQIIVEPCQCRDAWYLYRSCQGKRTRKCCGTFSTSEIPLGGPGLFKLLVFERGQMQGYSFVSLIYIRDTEVENRGTCFESRRIIYSLFVYASLWRGIDQSTTNAKAVGYRRFHNKQAHSLMPSDSQTAFQVKRSVFEA